MMRLWLALAAGLVAASSVQARAQTQESAAATVEVGGELAGIAGTGDGTFVLAGAGPSVTLKLTRRLGVGLLTEILRGGERDDTRGFYLTQVGFQLQQSGDRRRSLALNVGAGGLFSYRHFREARVGRPDGSVVVYPGYKRLRVGFNTFSAGITRHEVVSRFAAFTLGAHAFIAPGAIALRGTAGVTFGRYR